MANSSTNVRPEVWYVAFDKRTGRVVHTHCRFSVEANKHVEVPEADLRNMLAQDASLRAGLTDQDLANLDILKVGPHDAVPHPGAGMMVDVTHRKIVPKPALVLTADKRELAGDGRDSAKIEVRAVDAHGEPLRTVKDTIKVTVTRGKLSARGGVVDLVEGRATITLTSVAETVAYVRADATSLSGTCARGYLTFEFV
jgi:hypothetical protein